MPRKKQEKESNTVRRKKRKGKDLTLNSKVIAGLVKVVKEGGTFEQACMLNEVARSTGFSWLTAAKKARLEIHHAESDEKIEQILSNRRLHLELLDAIEKAKARSCIDRDAKIQQWGEAKKDWRALAYLNKVYEPAIYSEQGIINRGVADKFDELLNNVFWLLSPSAYREVKEAITQCLAEGEIAKVNQQKFDLIQMDEIKAVQVLMESEWLNQEKAGAIASEYLKMREAVREFLSKRSQE